MPKNKKTARKTHSSAANSSHARATRGGTVASIALTNSTVNFHTHREEHKQTIVPVPREIIITKLKNYYLSLEDSHFHEFINLPTSLRFAHFKQMSNTINGSESKTDISSSKPSTEERIAPEAKAGCSEHKTNSTQSAHTTEKSITIETIYRTAITLQQSHLIIIGEPRIGKSTMCQWIAYLWANGALWPDWSKRFSTVFWFPLDKLHEAKSAIQEAPLTTALCKIFFKCQNTADYQESLQAILAAKDCLFILDGWDKIAKDSTDFCLLLRSLTAYGSVIFTSRPYPSPNILTLGWTTFEKISFLNYASICESINHYHYAITARALFTAWLKDKLDFLKLAEIPFNLRQFCELREERPTECGLMKTLMRHLLRHHLAKKAENQNVENQIDDWLYEQCSKELDYLGDLAFKALEYNTSTTSTELQRNLANSYAKKSPSLSLLICELELGFLRRAQAAPRIVHSELDTPHEFTHSLFQNFLAAKWLSNQDRAVSSNTAHAVAGLPYFSQMIRFFNDLNFSPENSARKKNAMSPAPTRISNFRSTEEKIPASEISDVPDEKRTSTPSSNAQLKNQYKTVTGLGIAGGILGLLTYTCASGVIAVGGAILGGGATAYTIARSFRFNISSCRRLNTYLTSRIGNITAGGSVLRLIVTANPRVLSGNMEARTGNVQEIIIDSNTPIVLIQELGKSWFPTLFGGRGLPPVPINNASSSPATNRQASTSSPRTTAATRPSSI